MQRDLNEAPELQFARNEQFTALLRLDCPDFVFLKAESCLSEAYFALNGDTIPPVTYCITAYGVP